MKTTKESNKRITKDFQTQYRKVQQMGSTSISLLRHFENDKLFMAAFQKEFSAAPVFADVSKYWRSHYSDEEMKAGFEEGNKRTISKKGTDEVGSADFVEHTPFETHLNQLQNEFHQLIEDGKVSDYCYTRNITETNTYKQFKAINDVFNGFKEMKGFENTASDLLIQAEQFGKGIIREIEKIDYIPVREKVINTIINDNENIHIHLNALFGGNNAERKSFEEKYKTIKMYLNNYLSKQLSEQIKSTIESSPSRQIVEKKFSVLEWATIFYYADETKLLPKNRFIKTRIEKFMSEHPIDTTPDNFKTKYYEAKRRINEKNDYPISKLELIIPFLKENYQQTVTKVENDITYLEEERID